MKKYAPVLFLVVAVLFYVNAFLTPGSRSVYLAVGTVFLALGAVFSRRQTKQ